MLLEKKTKIAHMYTVSAPVMGMKLIASRTDSPGKAQTHKWCYS